MSGDTLLLSERARKKLIFHAKQVLFFNGLREEERGFMIDLLRDRFKQEGLTGQEIDDTMETLEMHLRVDPFGGHRSSKEIRFREPL